MADVEARVMPDSRLYLYGSLDEREDRYCSERYRVASTRDLVSWTVHETSFTIQDAPWAEPGSTGGASFLDGVSSFEELPAYVTSMLPPEAMEVTFAEFAAAVRAATAHQQPEHPLLYAPDAIERDGKYYLYFCASDDTEGVAVSNSPAGPFKSARQLPISGIDPSVFVDDDAQAYLYWGQFSAHAARLNPDMVSIDETSIVDELVTEKRHHFHEGSSMRKRNGIYYLVFANTSRGRPTCLGYAMSRSPLGPFEYGGVIIDNADGDPHSWNNHGSIAEFDNRWYVFYHRSSRGSSSMRRVCMEPIEFTPDGRIAEARMTSQGSGRPYGPGDDISGYEACGVSGNARIAPRNNSEAVVGFDEGDSATFRYVESAVPLVSVDFTVEGSGTLDLLVNGSVACRLASGSTSTPLDVPPGSYEIVLRAREPQELSFFGMRFNA